MDSATSDADWFDHFSKKFYVFHFIIHPRIQFQYLRVIYPLIARERFDIEERIKSHNPKSIIMIYRVIARYNLSNA